ncbi:hypothetical protein [Geobacillus sp. C56-T2]|uniref:hypothetical protein n=1 Tax=Geobacillus sp. C56-T2 TaxID=600773 RepID=UPI0011A97901|nr:hypothetical protein [Geobacillus sp. C56-T2]
MKNAHLQFINNTDHQRKDANLAFTSILFLIIGLFFIIISILLVGGLDVYRSYSIGATVGGDVVAQSFKSQGELMLGIFSLPLIKYFYKERKIALLSFLLIFLVSLSLLGGARKFLVFPFGFLLLLYLIDNKVSLERLFKFDDKSFLKRMLKICSLIVFFLVALALIQNVRDGLGFVIDLKSIEKTIVHQFGFAYLVPNAFIYHNYEVLTQLNFSIIDFFRLLFNAVVFCIPRFMYPNKENLLFSNTQSFKTDFHTVGGSSFIEYFLTNSIYSVILFYFLLCLLIGYVFNLNQKKENPVYLYLYFSSLIILIWFNYNWGYVFVTKTFIIQIVLTIWFYYYVSILLEKIFSRNEVSILLEKVFSRNKLDS